MKLEKIKNIKQKIITIPIIMITLISFIIPNYSHAGILTGFVTDKIDDLCKTLIDVMLIIPDAAMLGLQNCFVEDTSYSDMIKKESLNGEETWLNTVGKIFHYTIMGPAQGLVKFFGDKMNQNNQEMVISSIKISPLQIFANKITVLDVNIFKEQSKTGDKQSIAGTLRTVVATWYYTMRNIALVLMMLVLVFIGIKITISSVASDKAKYKQLLVDWLVAICLLIFMHYIMVFMVNIVDNFTNMFSVKNIQADYEDPFINMARMKASYPIDSDSDNTAVDNFYWAFIYFMLVFFTIIFIVQYLRRVIKLIFLTLFAPIMALTYPLDKMADGKAQGFDRWLKEYIFNLLIQPLHLLLYLVLISSVEELCLNNPIYTLVVLASFIPMEKTLREFLGFDRGRIKGPNPAGLLTAMTLGQKAIDIFKPSNVRGGKNNNGKNDNTSNPQPIDTSRGDRAFDLLADGEENNNENNRNRNDHENENTNTRLNESGQQWQDYMDLQEEDNIGQNDNAGSNGIGQQLNSQEMDNNSLGLDESGQQWLDYINSQEEDNNIGSNETRQQGQNYMDEDHNETIQNHEQNGLTEQNDERENRVKNKFGLIGNKFRPVGNGIKAVMGNNPNAVTNGLKKGMKIAGAMTLGLGAATIAAAYGATTGDPVDTIKKGLGGFAAGAVIGNKAVDGVSSAVKGIEGVQERFMSGYDPVAYNEMLKRRQSEQDYKDIINDNSAMLALRVKAQKYNMSDKQLNQTIRNYSHQGITNYKDITKGMELQQEAGVSEKQAIGAIKLSKDFDKSTLRKDEAKVKQEIQNNLQGKDANPEQKAQKSVDLMKMVYGMTPTRRL